MIYTPFTYQTHATDHVINNPYAGLFLDMGLGKTVSTLTAIDQLMFDRCEVNKVLVIAPKRVAEEVWLTEKDKWDHLRHLRISKVLGTERQRIEALKAKADLYVINRENVVWLISHLGGAWPFDMVVIDELSSFKSNKAARFKALRMVRPKINRVVGLTGTPAPNGLLDLWSQMYLLDMGERLGKTIGGYRERYFTPGKRNGHIVYEYKLRVDKEDADLIGADYYEKKIYELIGDICISMKSEDYLDLPERITRDRIVNLSPAILRQYQDFEKQRVLSLPDDEEVSAINAAGLRNKLMQFANGAVYDENKNYHEIHNEKIDALEEILDVLNGKPLLLFYTYRHDLERIKKYLHKYKPVELKSAAEIYDWNRKKISFMVTHPASASHGLNLQAGGHNSLWFGPTDNLEWYQQANKRLDRLGQVENPIVNRLAAANTMDAAVYQALADKTSVQDALMDAVKAIVKKYKN